MNISINDQSYVDQARLFKVLTHSVRLKILDLLREDEECVCHIEAHLGYRQAYISQQLKVLRSAGIIEENREGRNIFYKIKNPAIFSLIDAIRKIDDGEPMNNEYAHTVVCSCPKCQTKSMKWKKDN
jgi:DNA-binding transcriptional ArsR family regulator